MSATNTTSNNFDQGPDNERLLRSAIRLNSILLALVCGALAGGGLFVMTLLSLNRGLPDTGQLMNLLGVFLPGYRVSTAGAFIGLFWGTLIGAIAGLVIYRIYARSIPQQIERLLASETELEFKNSTTLRFAGHHLGLALGTLVAASLLLSTSWLVIRGTADESSHAALLANYLPGYTVSITGALLGAAEIFIITYAACAFLGLIYNRVIDWRHPGDNC